ncbi:MAG TPA: hypothetical protein P5081_14020 [Phycisphaerae bacterium]|nr:hypothetical protein [Phycisphaerae bacterium]HRW53988.1 hypothetical protein [Phycisphaerae bacterium]
MRHRPSNLQCILLSVVGTLLLCWPFSGYYWTLWNDAPATPQSGGHPTFISGTSSEFSGAALGAMGLEDSAVYLDAFIGAAIAILLYAAIHRLSGAADVLETRCRKCREILRGLDTPRCPACGEAI